MELTLIVLLKAVFIAIVEGITEFIPVSSTGHMVLFGNLINFKGPSAATFEICIQLGAILAVTLIYRDKFINILSFEKGKNPIKQLFGGDSKPTGGHLALAIFPILALGFLFHKLIKTYLFSPLTVAIGLITGGIIMILVEMFPRKMEVEKLDDISLKQAFIIGVGQCFALWPGMSRSGSTMVTSLFLGIKHKAAADFSFIIAVPVMFIAVGYDLTKSWSFLNSNDLIYIGIGFIVAFLISWGSVTWFLKILSKIKLIPFGIYRILVGILTILICYP